MKSLRNISLIVAVAALGLAACVPDWTVPTIAPYSGPESHTIVVLGDSTAAQVGADYDVVRAYNGLPGQIVNTAVSGSTPCSTGFYNWLTQAPAKVAQHGADAVVLTFAGHEHDPALVWQQWASCLYLIVEALEPTGAQVFVTLPPVSRWQCNPAHTETADMAAAALYVRNVLRTQKPAVQLVNLRDPMSPSETYTQQLRWPDGSVHDVRNPADCLHLTTAGGSVAAWETVADVRGLW